MLLARKFQNVTKEYSTQAENDYICSVREYAEFQIKYAQSLEIVDYSIFSNYQHLHLTIWPK